MNTLKTLKGAGLYFGITGSLTVMAFIMIFLQDWTGRFQFLSYLLVLPIIFLLIATKLPLIGGLLLIVLGAGAVVFDIIYTPAHPGLIPGRGLVYTLIFVALPLLISGVFYILIWRKSR